MPQDILRLYNVVVDTPTGEPLDPPADIFLDRFRAPASQYALTGRTRQVYAMEDQATLSAISKNPTAIQPAPVTIAQEGDYVDITLLSDGEVNLDAISIDSAANLVVAAFGRGLLRLTVSDAWRALSAVGAPISTTLTASAPKKFKPAERVIWTLTVNSTGAAVIVGPAAPSVVAAPQALTFGEAANTLFTVPVATLFAAPDTPVTYNVLNADGSALTLFTLVSLVGGVATLRSPDGAGEVGVFQLRFTVTDNSGRTAFTLGAYTVTANPEIQILGTPPDRDINADLTGTWAIDLATIFSDTEGLTYAYTQSDGTVLPAGYSVNLVGTVATYTYPTHGGAASFIFRITATETGPLARAKFVDFNVVRPSPAVIIITPTPLSFPENATTRFRIDLSQILVGGSGYSFTGPGGSALPGNYTVTAVGGGVFDVDGVFANNQILSHSIEYRSAAPVAVASTTWSSRHNPPAPGAIDIAAITDGDVLLDVVAQSDDPAVNLIVAGSAAASEGTATIEGARIRLTPPAQATGVTVNYTLEAGSGGPRTAGAAVVNWREYQLPEPNGNFAPQSTQGQSFTAVNLAPFFVAGDAPIDPAGYEFIDLSTGQRAGKTQVTAAGTFTISAAGFYNYAGLATFVGSIGLAISAVDLNGRASVLNLNFSHTQLASTPTSDVDIPNTSDGLPIMALGMNDFRDNNGESMPASVHDSSISGSTKWPNGGNLIDGSYNPQTGVLTIAPGQTQVLRPMRETATNYPGLNPGKYIIKYEVIPNTGAGGSANTVDVNVLTGGQSFSNDGSSGNTIRRSFTTPDPSTAKLQPTVSGGANGGQIIIRHCGREADENNPTRLHGNFLTYAAKYKMLRWMKPQGVINARQTRSSDTIPDGWHMMQRDYTLWPSTLPATNRNKIVGGMQRGIILRASKQIQVGAWITLPTFLGFHPVEATIWGCPGTVYQTASGIRAEWIPMRDALAANVAAISAAMDVEWFNEGVAWANSAVAEGFPDRTAIVVECGNEGQNTAYAQNHGILALWGRALGYTPAGPETYALGWITARAQRAFLAGFRSIKPNQYIYFVLSLLKGQSATENAKANQGYEAERTRAAVVNKLDCFLSVTQYFSGAMKRQDNRARAAGNGNLFGDAATNALTFSQLWQAAHLAGEAALWTRIENYWADPATATNNSGPTDTIYGNLADLQNWIAQAISWGFRGFVPYEGSDHDNWDNANGLATVYPAAGPAIWRYKQSNNAQRSFELWINLMKSLSPMNPAVLTGWRPANFVMNFIDAGDQTQSGSTAIAAKPWTCRNPDEILAAGVSGYARALATFLRGGSGGGGGTPPPPPPPSLYVEDFTVNDTFAKVQTAGWTGASGALSTTWGLISGNGKLVFRGTSTAHNARYSFRDASTFNPILNFEVEVGTLASATGTILRFHNQAGNIRFELRNTAAELEILNLYSPNNPAVPSTETVLLTTSGIGDLRDTTYRTLRIEIFYHATNGYIKVWLKTGASTWSKVGEFLGNPDPLGIAPILHALELRLNRAFSKFQHIADNVFLS